MMLVALSTAVTLKAQSLVFSNFTSTAGLTLTSSSTALGNGTDGTVLRLVTATTNDRGGAFSTALRTVTGGFSTAFEFRLSGRGGSLDTTNTAGADGFVFVLQHSGPSALGATGEYMGYGGGTAIGTSLGIEFDTFKNSTQSDPSSNHIGVDTNGSVVSLATANITPDFDSVGTGTKWTGWIDYDGSTLSVRVSNTGVRPSVADLAYSISSSALQSILGATTAYVGFTAATGGAYANHDIIDWTFSDTYVPGGVTAGSAIPEPATYAGLAGMLALTMAGVARMRSRRALAAKPAA
jgi:hypothetical protein